MKPIPPDRLIPDVRDGLTELERTILFVLYEARKEYGDRHIPMSLVFGRVVEIIDTNREEFERMMQAIARKESEKRYPI